MPRTIKLSDETLIRLDKRIEEETNIIISKAKTHKEILKLYIQAAHNKGGISYNTMISKLLDR